MPQPWKPMTQGALTADKKHLLSATSKANSPRDAFNPTWHLKPSALHCSKERWKQKGIGNRETSRFNKTGKACDWSFVDKRYMKKQWNNEGWVIAIIISFNKSILRTAALISHSNWPTQLEKCSCIRMKIELLKKEMQSGSLLHWKHCISPRW